MSTANLVPGMSPDGIPAGSSAFPIAGYLELTVGRVLPLLGELTPVQLLQVRDFERRHANRVVVLDAIEKAIG